MRGRLASAAADPLFEPYREAFRRALPRVGVFVGAGASHSWIWFADLLDRLGLYDVEFIDEGRVLEGRLGDLDFLLVGGGDTYAMAESLGEEGAAAVERWVRGGGLYFGSCAGAYLVMTGVDLQPFTPFKLVEGGMLNVMAEPPEPRCLAHKYLAPYGEEWVFHPVYGEVELVAGSGEAGFPCFASGEPVRTVLFGGPVLSSSRDHEVVARYGNLTDRAAYTWERQDAARLLCGRPAVLRAAPGKGTAIASGPHLEHPLFPRANALVAELMLRHWAAPKAPRDPAARSVLDADAKARAWPPSNTPVDVMVRELLHEIKRQVSNARIVGFGLEKMPVTWQVGVKVWEPEKIRMFLEYPWRMLPYLEAHAGSIRDVECLHLLAKGYEGVTRLVKTLRIKVESNDDSLVEATSLLTTLKGLTAGFLSLYFHLRMEEDRSNRVPVRPLES